MFILKSIILCILIVIVPFLIGNLIVCKEVSPIMRLPIPKYILGYFAALALFWILCVPMALLKITFSVLALVYSILIIILCAISIRIYYRDSFSGRLKPIWKTPKLTHFEIIYLLLFLILLGVQLYFAVFYESTVWSYDDYDYVVRSLDTITSNHMFLNHSVTGEEVSFSLKRVLNSWDIYIAYLSKISGFHVTTVAHTIIPPFFLLIAYLVYAYIAEQLFVQRENRLIFLCVLSVAFIFGLYSPYSLTFRLLVTLWQGKAILSAIVIPFLIIFLLDAYNQKWNPRTAFYLVIISMTACSLTMMGAGMSILIYVTMLVILSIYQRKITALRYCICGCMIPALQLLLYFIMR